MSCETNFHAFCALVAGAGSDVAAAFGGDSQQAQAALDQIFQTARNQSPGAASLPGDRLAALQARTTQQHATDATTRLFAEMRQRGVKPPTHSQSGLPKPDARRGYAAVYRTLQAIRERKPLPALAQQIRTQQQLTRTIRGVGVDAHGLRRCSGCGRFASASNAHLCPHTASAEDLTRTLMRRLKVPATAYAEADMQALIESARQGPVRMVHGLTGEEVEVTLDGLPQALTTGFVPVAWQQQPGLVFAEVGGSRIVPVLSGTGLQLVSARSGTAQQQAAAAFGLALSPGTPVATAASLPAVQPHQVQHRAWTTVNVGTTYDAGRFMGTEYRKGGAAGATITVAGETYRVGQRSTDPRDFGSARTTGLEPPPIGGVAVGRTLVEAVGILAEGAVVETADGQIQVYATDRQHLLAVYDPTNRAAGDTAGTRNASAPQMAAVLAHLALHPQTPFDTALGVDLVNLRNGIGSPLAAADGAYIAIKHGLLANGQDIDLGGQVGTLRCDACGQFMGDAHACPVQAAAPTPTPTGAPAFDPAQGGVNPATGFAGTPTDPYAPIQVDAEVGPPVSAMAVEDDAALGAGAPVEPAPDVPEPVTAVASEPPPAAAPVAVPPVVVQPHVDVHVDAPQVAVEAPQITVQPPQVSVEAPTITVAPPQVQMEAPQVQVTVQLDPQQFAEAIIAGWSQAAPGAALPAVTTLDPALRDALTRMAGAVERLATTPPSTPITDDRLVTATERLTAALTGAELPAPVAAPAPSVPPPAAVEEVERVPRTGMARPENLPLTGQEHILASVMLPAPDPYWSNMPDELGGPRATPATEYLPQLDPNYEINGQAEQILRAMSASLQLAGRSPKHSQKFRTFGLYGGAGTGKNTLAAQLAASIKTVDGDGNVTQGLDYTEITITEQTSVADAIGTTILTTDPQTGATVSRPKLGKIGEAALTGGVICINEIVRNPKLTTAFQPLIEDGVIEIDSAEAGKVRIPVHPATVFVFTWNPGFEDDPDRPGQAPLSRMATFRLDAPTLDESKRRAAAFFNALDGKDAPSTDNEQRRQDVLKRSYGVPASITPTERELDAATNFWNDLRTHATGGIGERDLGKTSPTSTAPGPRELQRFIALAKALGNDWQQATSIFDICCDQDPSLFPEQKRLIMERFAMHFGEDGQALNRSSTPPY